ncbi:MAG: hypothetical protein GY757_19150 [bacterium]|nr:hypothetical protein [bacterium]
MRAKTDAKYMRKLEDSYDENSVLRYRNLSEIIKNILVETGHDQCAGFYNSVMDDLLARVEYFDHDAYSPNYERRKSWGKELN